MLKIKKSLVIATLVILSTTAIYGQTKGTCPYEKAVKIAIENNLNIERQKEEIEDTEDKLTKGDFSGAPAGLPETLQSIAGPALEYERLTDKRQSDKMNYEAQKEALAINIKEIYIQIQQLEKENELLDKKLINQRRLLSMDEVRFLNGQISMFDLENQKDSIEKIENQKQENKLNIQMRYKDLRNIMNSDKCTEIEYLNLKYTPLSQLKLSKEAQLGKAISQAPSIYSQNAYIKQLSEKMKYSLLDQSPTALERDEMANNIKIKDIDLRIQKQNIENSVIEIRNQIEDIELNIKNIQDEIKTTKSNLKNIDIKVKLGFKTSFDKAQEELKLDELNQNLQNLENRHQILIEKYQKPYLLSLN